jgi:hypothetical protein
MSKRKPAEQLEHLQHTIKDGVIAWGYTGDDKGRGVFAMADLKQGDVLEISPVIVVDKANINQNGTAPDGYLLMWDEETKGDEYCMPLGYIMLYNHSRNPNVMLESDYEAMTITAIAARDIEAGEELTWDYKCEIWFDEE